jgi:hypothetical protein
MVYMHGDATPGKQPYSMGIRTEIYATRYPPDGVNVRLTWLNACSRHPEFFGTGKP